MKKRFITGLLIGLVVIPLLLLGNIPYLIGILLLLGGVAYEISNIKKHNLFIKITTILLVTLPTLYYYFNSNISSEMQMLLIFLPIFVYYTVAVWNEKFEYAEANFLSVFTILMTLFGKSALYIRNINDNANALAFVLLTTCSVDIFALIIGCKFGKHRLNERISPKKSIEGAIGGATCALAIAFVFNWFFPIFPSDTTNVLNLGFNSSLTIVEPFKVLGIAIVLTLAGQLGDLFFSMIKRHYQIKDFSNLLPGHGGVTDRIDSVCVNFILFNLLFVLLITL